ncbi:hypothetical protein M9Y10_023119 [Tritrichomonas musculus]|uniref:Right handed beta helix domain-containing protein n=1 Tax=Tritrichomonas musculus TaxID=1915356 RepID=A0ABR2KU94_9EUKA
MFFNILKISSFSYDSNYLVDDEGKIMVTIPVIEIEGEFQINLPIKISSNCNRVIEMGFFQFLQKLFHFRQYHSKQLFCHLTVSDCKQNRILITNSIVSADNLVVSNFDNSLILCQSGSYVTISHSQFHHSRKDGIKSVDQTYIEIKNCNFSDMESCGIISDGSNTSVKNFHFQNMICAIEIIKTTDFLIENCHITKTSQTTTSITNNSQGTITDNTISDTEGNGINVHNSAVLVKNSVIENSFYPCIRVAMMNSKRHGICVRDELITLK